MEGSGGQAESRSIKVTPPSEDDRKTRRPRNPTPDKRATEEEAHRNQDEKTTRREDLDGTRIRRETEGDRHQDAHRHAKDPTNRKSGENPPETDSAQREDPVA